MTLLTWIFEQECLSLWIPSWSDLMLLVWLNPSVSLLTLSLLTTVTSNPKCFIVDSFVSVGAIVFVYCLVCCHLAFTSFGTFWYCVYYCHFKFGNTFFSWYHCLQCRSLIHCQRWMRSICSVRLGYISWGFIFILKSAKV